MVPFNQALSCLRSLLYVPSYLHPDGDNSNDIGGNILRTGSIRSLSIPPEIIDTHELQAITLDYRRECQQDDIVDSLTSREPLDDAAVLELTESNGSAASKKDGEDLSRFLHILRSSGNGLEINRCRTEWRKKPAKR